LRPRMFFSLQAGGVRNFCFRRDDFTKAIMV
jgi:hypothetical protein